MILLDLGKIMIPIKLDEIRTSRPKADKLEKSFLFRALDFLIRRIIQEKL